MLHDCLGLDAKAYRTLEGFVDDLSAFAFFGKPYFLCFAKFNKTWPFYENLSYDVVD